MSTSGLQKGLENEFIFLELEVELLLWKERRKILGRINSIWHGPPQASWFRQFEKYLNLPEGFDLMEHKNQKGVQTASTFWPSSYLLEGTKWEQASFIKI